MSTTHIDDIDDVDFYRIPFNLVLPLLIARKVHLKDGFAFVPDNDISSLFVNTLETNLQKGFKVHFEFVCIKCFIELHFHVFLKFL